MKKIRFSGWWKWLVRTGMLNLGTCLIIIGLVRLDKGFDIIMFNDVYRGASGAWFFLVGGKFVIIGVILLIVLWLSEKIS